MRTPSTPCCVTLWSSSLPARTRELILRCCLGYHYDYITSPSRQRNADAHRQTQPTKGAPGADPLSRALGRRQDHLARVIASIEKREAVFGMLPDDSDGSPEGEEESEEGDEPDGEGEGEGEEDEEDDSEGDGEGGEGNQGKEKVDGGAGESGQAAKGKRRRRHEAYAYDGWIDDEEMEQRANARCVPRLTTSKWSSEPTLGMCPAHTAPCDVKNCHGLPTWYCLSRPASAPA